jgi:hypothetical protein
MMSGQPILSGKPFSTFSMARLKVLQLRLTLTPLSNTTKDSTPRSGCTFIHVSFLSEADEMHTRK